MVGGRLNLQICYTCRHADIYRNTNLDMLKKQQQKQKETAQAAQQNTSTPLEDSHTQTAQILEVTRGRKSLDWRASLLKDDSLAIHHMFDLLSDVISLFVLFPLRADLMASSNC